MEQIDGLQLLVGLLQLICVGLSTWVLLKLVSVLERLAVLESKFDAFPVEQISKNRHRIENLERFNERVDARLLALEVIRERQSG